MGLPMNNLHAPTILSGPTSGSQGDRSALDRLTLMELILRKDNLEAELKALGSVLDSVSQTAFT
jgi:26S proteasome non-ATPase regulatory subunit 9